MLCPQCQNEFPDWHFYCPQCRTQVQDYLAEEPISQPTMLERVGRVMLDLLVLLFFVGAGVLLWRAIKWQDLFNQFQPTAGVAAPAADNRPPRPPSATKHSTEPAAQPSKPTAASKPERTPTVESVRQMPQKIEELATAEEATPKPTPTPGKPDTVQPASQSSTAPDKAALSVEQIDARQSEAAGFVAVNSYVPARIYVDGQFSGVTPRTVRLAAGNHQIRLIAEGYEDWTRRVQLKSRQQIGVMASLKKKAGQ